MGTSGERRVGAEVTVSGTIRFDQSRKLAQ
jgi:hypothetical protein